MKLLAPSLAEMSDLQLTGYFANFMVEVTANTRTRAGPRKESGRRVVKSAPDSEPETPTTRRIYYEDMGDPNHPSGAAHHGLGAQLLLWRKGFCEKLVDQGLRVIRYDNRDVGLSSKVTGRHTGAKLLPRMVRSFLGRRSPAVYTLEDLADDAAALLDHLGIDTCAHRRRVDGRDDRADRRRQVPRAHQDARRSSSPATTRRCCRRRDPSSCGRLLQRPADSTREAIVANAVRVAKIIGSPGYPRSEERAAGRRGRGLRARLLPRGHRAALRRGAGQR